MNSIDVSPYTGNIRWTKYTQIVSPAERVRPSQKKKKKKKKVS